MRGTLFMLLACMQAGAAGTEPKLRAEEYPQHVRLANGGVLAIEFHGRGIPAAKGGVFLPAHVAVEAAYYPPAGEKVELRGGQFLLRIDRMKLGIPPETPGMVAASLKYGDWEQRRGLEVEGAAGPVVVGPRGPARRFPGGPGSPDPPRGPADPGKDKPDPQELEAGAVKEFALNEGETRQVVAGYLYYRWGGNLRKIKQLTLDFSGPGGPASISIPLK
jgi:hypothetical protein